MSNKKIKIRWDGVWVHGKHPDAKYIRYKENTEALTMIAPDLKKAYSVRKELYLEPYKNVQKMFISWLRSYLNQKQK